ncbi:MAG: GDP-mannose 4,6-dehydratase [Candidatus Omnitrophica bacterium]|nr:GDP-mannose 4,6-dehydratase [Candidatus Omnitrophota bacterium]
MAKRDKIRRALITGMAGSGGSYLAEHIVEDHPEVEIHGISRWHSTTAAQNLARVRDRVVLHECDLTDFSSVFSILRSVQPDVVFHLASHANVRASFLTPLSVIQNNVLGTANLLEAVRLAGTNPVIQICSTSEVYGQVDPKDVPIAEEAPFRPASPYAVSKAVQDLLGMAYFRSYRMPIVVMIDVRDAMVAYWEAVVHCEPGEAYNIGGTTTISVGKFLELLVKRSRVPIRTRLDPNLLRPADVTLQIPRVDKFTRATGWAPRYSFEESVEFLLSYWRSQVEQFVHETRTVLSP